MKRYIFAHKQLANITMNQKSIEHIALYSFVLVGTLVEKKKTNKWLADQIGKDQATVSKWCTNTTQPTLETLVEIAKILEVDIRELLVPTDNQKIMMTIL